MTSISLMLVSLSIFMAHPLSLGMILLFQTIIIAILTSFMYTNFWFSYILMLIMIGGMLILFIYMTSIASNEKFKFNLYLSIPMLIPLIIPYITYNLDYTNTLWSTINYPLSKFINFPFNLILIFLIVYLLITLIAIVKITNISLGPLRQKF